MKIVKPEQVEQLEKISMGLEAIDRAVVQSDKPKSPGFIVLLNDMRWLTKELREAYGKIEELAKGTGN